MESLALLLGCRQSAKKNLCDQLRILFDRSGTLGQKSLIENREIRFDEHRGDIRRVDISKYAFVDPLLNHACGFVDDAAIAIGAVAARLYAHDFALVEEDAKEIALVVEVG